MFINKSLNVTANKTAVYPIPLRLDKIMRKYFVDKL